MLATVFAAVPRAVDMALEEPGVWPAVVRLAADNSFSAVRCVAVAGKVSSGATLERLAGVGTIPALMSIFELDLAEDMERSAFRKGLAAIQNWVTRCPEAVGAFEAAGVIRNLKATADNTAAPLAHRQAAMDLLEAHFRKQVEDS